MTTRDMATSPTETMPPSLTQTDPMKVGLFVEPSPFTHVCGYSNRFKEMLKYLDKAGDEVSVLTTDRARNPPSKFIKYPITTTSGFTFPMYQDITLSLDIWQRKGWSLLEKFRPDVLHATAPGFMCLTSIAYAKAFRIPLVMSYHTHLPIYARDYLGFIPGIVEASWIVMNMVLNQADLVLTTSPQIKKELEDHGVQNVDVWRKGVDIDVFNPKFRSTEMRSVLTDGNPEDPLMIYVGRLGAEKKLKALKDVLERIPNLRLAIVGKGPQEAELKEHFKGTNTVFTGLLQGEPLSQAFASADVFAMPSDSETLGFVVLESMASGVPVVGAKAGGIPNLINEGENGYLVEVEDGWVNINTFTERIKAVLEDQKLRDRLSINARGWAEKWGWEAATSQLRNVQYKRAIKNFNKKFWKPVEPRA
eukprot:CAMPEP_0184477994 /NCGR_PEP_ID=MMETSP0113_2-20130426/115_1 /TAXON_ID=91329 /ORGANISM="Norrisiella sphaerica, Strain BC52" /LENGTH=419 /DNA_ID=CAMNT_0026855617 /DNA_START=410 /DNA_END=1669 /DNA_ORIENTATION=-